MKTLEFFKKNALSFSLMLITATLMTVAGIIYKQNPLIILPLYVSLFVGILQTKANRYSLLVGGLNSIIYTIVFIYLGVYATAVSTFFFSCIVQLASFLRWNNRKYEHSTRFRKLSTKWRIITVLVSLSAFLVICFALDKAGSVYQVIDSLSSVVGAIASILTLFVFVEYAYLMLVSSVVAFLLYYSMMLNSPAEIVYVIFSVYSIICVTRGFFSARQIYKQQQNELNLEANDEKSTADLS